MYMMIKHLHMTLAIISLISFMVRGPLAIKNHSLMNKKWLKITPHVIDTLLIVSAILLAASIGASPFNSPWIAAKLIALIVYIGLGVLVIKGRGSEAQQWATYGCAMLVFLYIISVAFTKSPVIF